MSTPAVRIAGAQGFYGDSPAAALAIVREQAADYLMHDALAELTLSILKKDQLRDPALGYTQDIAVLGRMVYPSALRAGMKIVSNAGGLNPIGAAQRLQAILREQGITGIKIACITGDDMLPHLPELLAGGETLEHLDFGTPYIEGKYTLTHANVYIGARAVMQALNAGAHIVLSGRVADPALVLGIAAHHHGWRLEGDLSQAELDLLAAATAAGHVIECGGQASGGNSYAEFPTQDYEFWNLGYPIAHIYADGKAIFTKATQSGGKVSRDTVREQLVYEIHDPTHYITPDVVVDLSQIGLQEIAPNQVVLTGVKGKPRPEKLKLAMGHHEGYISESFTYFTFPYAYQKARRWEEAVHKIWASMPNLKISRMEFNYIGLGAIHPGVLPLPSDAELAHIQELGLRIAIAHPDEATGKAAFAAITCLGLNGSPGVTAMPTWGKVNRATLGLYPTLIDRRWIQEEISYLEL